jgi:phosphate:Na+ symporter
MTEVAIGELNEMYDIVKRNIERCIKALENDDLDMAREVLVQEKAIDQMEKELRRNHMMRLNVGLCNPSSGIIFLDVISNLERIGDHTAHMANIILGNE